MIGPNADAASFQAVRPRLFAIASRVLGNATDADDVVQDAWIRWQGTDRGEVRDAAAFLAATTTRLAINVIRSARSRHETSVEPEILGTADPSADLAADAERTEAVELALRVLLERLSPTERAAYLLREAFDYPYREIAQLLGLSEVNARQIVTRARRSLCEGQGRPIPVAELTRLSSGFTAAARGGDLPALERVLVAA